MPLAIRNSFCRLAMVLGTILAPTITLAAECDPDRLIEQPVNNDEDFYNVKVVSKEGFLVVLSGVVPSIDKMTGKVCPSYVRVTRVSLSLNRFIDATKPRFGLSANASKTTVPGLASGGAGAVSGFGLSGSATNQNDAVVVGQGDTSFTNPIPNTSFVSYAYHALRYSQATGSVDLGTLAGSQGYSSAYGVSADGSLVVGASTITAGVNSSGTIGTLHAFRWTQGSGMTDLGSLAANGASRAFGVSNDGVVIVGDTSIGGGVTHAFRYTQATNMTDIGSLSAGFNSRAAAVSADGTTIIGESQLNVSGSPQTRAFRWTQAGGMTNLGVVSGHTASSATAASANGAVVVGVSDPNFVTFSGIGLDYSDNARAFRWTQAGGFQNLNTLLANAGVDMTGITLISATSISPDGQYIGGTGFSSAKPGVRQSYIVRYVDGATVNTTTAHDFNADAKSDIVWRNTAGDNAMWLMNGATISSVAGLPNVPTNWYVVGQRDFNGDGKTDLLWASTTGDVAIWLMNGSTITSVASLGNVGANWGVAGTADFNADGKGDILWRSTAGDNAIWFMNGTTLSSIAVVGNVPTNWTVVGAADFNADGKGDILWRNSAGDNAIWLMNGATISSVAGLGNVSVNWSIVGTADFNADGKSDIIWRNSGGDNAIWLMNGATISSVAGLGNIPTNWSVVSNGDYNGDGNGDILWRNSAGDNAIWFMNGTTLSSIAGLGNVPTNWTIQNAAAN